MLELPAQLVYHIFINKKKTSQHHWPCWNQSYWNGSMTNGPFHEGCWCSQTELCAWMVGELMPAVKVCISTWTVCFVFGFGEGTWGPVLTPDIRDQLCASVGLFFPSLFCLSVFSGTLCWVKLKRMNKDRYKLAFPRLSFWFVLPKYHFVMLASSRLSA